MTTELKDPKLRFPEFKENIDLFRLGDIGSTYTGLSGKTKEDFGHGDAKYVTYINVYQNSISSIDGLELIEIDGKQNSVEYGDVFFTTSSETPDEVGLSSVWLHHTENVYLNSFCFGYRPNKEKHIDPYYLGYVLRSDSIRKKLILLAQGISRYNISKTKVMDIHIALPSIAEQQKIGTFFSKLDERINFQQKKVDSLKTLKKGFLQKMFPKEGQSVPEIRFPGFEGEWVLKKVGELVQESRIKGNKGDVAKKLTVKLWGKGVIAKENEVGSSNTQYFVRHKNQFIYSKLDFLNSAFGVIPELLDGFESTIDLPAFDCINVVPYFLYYSVIQPKFYLYNGNIANGSRKAKRINQDIFLDMFLYVPCIKEQQAIVNFISKLDENIALQQKQLETLKQLKQGLLQQMFI